MLLGKCVRALLTIGIALSLNEFAAGEETTPLKGPTSTTKRLGLKASDADSDVIEEVCRRRRLFKRRYTPEVYSAPPVTTYSSPPIEYTIPPEPSIAPSRVEPPTLPMPTTPPTFRYDGDTAASPKPMPQRAPASETKPSGPTLGPSPTERMVAAPKPATKRTYPAFGERRADDTFLLKRRRR